MHANRALAVVLGVLVLTFLAFLLYQKGPSFGWFPGCMFHRLTGWHCPGCGMTRAASAVLHGRIAEAFRFNPLGMVLLPIAVFGLSLEIAGWVRGRALPFRFQIRGRWVWLIFSVVMAFWLLRNIPIWPLTLLAPP